MDRFESRMTPRFLAESEKGMLREPRVTESGRETVEGFKEDKKGKRRTSVLSSFSLSWFSVIHVFMLSVHVLSSLVRLVTSVSGVDFWSYVSSAKSWWFIEWLAVISERGVVYMTGRREWAPVLNPEAHCTWAVMVTKMSELETEPERYEWNHWRAIDWMPKTEFRQERRMWWSVVSEAAERFNKRRTEMLSLSRAERISFTTCNKTVSVLCPAW